MATCVSLLALVFAGQATATIKGPERVFPGDLAVFVVDGAADGETFDWAVVGTDVATVDGKPAVQIVDATKRLFVDSSKIQAAFSSGKAGEFMVFVAVGSKDGGARLLRHKLAVGDPPPPPPPPSPDEPDKPLPDGQFKLAAFARQAAKATDTAKPAAAAVAVELKRLAGDLSIASAQTLVDKTAATLKAPGFLENAAWRRQWQAKLVELGFAKRSLLDYRAAWLETALGLEAFAGVK